MPLAAVNVMSKTPIRIAALGCALLMAGLTWVSSRAGLASFHAARAARETSETDIEKALALNSSDADSHVLRGAMFEVTDDPAAAVRQYERAIALRPRDYVLWLMFARGCELNGEREKAIAAARTAVPLAPFYAQPHWQLGNLLMRDGQTVEGFKELRLASSINSDFLGPIIDLAWHFSNGDVQFVIRTLNPQQPAGYQALASYFRKRGQIAAATWMYEAAGDVALKDRQAYVGELISTKHFKEAYALWNYGPAANSNNALGAIIDAGFEEEPQFNEQGFGWHGNNKLPSVTLSLDPANPREGRSSLQVNFNGDSDAAAPIISQLVLIEPKTNYQLHFYYRAEAIVSGGLPRISVLDAGDNQVLGQSGALTQATTGWLDASINFVSGASTEALQISLQRERCPEGPCPIFGRLWLDGFSLQKR